MATRGPDSAGIAEYEDAPPPMTLHEAADEFVRDDVLREALGRVAATTSTTTRG